VVGGRRGVWCVAGQGGGRSNDAWMMGMEENSSAVEKARVLKDRGNRYSSGRACTLCGYIAVG